MTMSHASPRDLPGGFNAPRIQAHIAEGHRHYEDIEKNWDKLVNEHEGEWVASYKGEFIFGMTIHDVIRGAREHSWPLDVVAVDQLNRQRAAVLLRSR